MGTVGLLVEFHWYNDRELIMNKPTAQEISSICTRTQALLNYFSSQLVYQTLFASKKHIETRESLLLLYFTVCFNAYIAISVPCLSLKPNWLSAFNKYVSKFARMTSKTVDIVVALATGGCLFQSVGSFVLHIRGITITFMCNCLARMQPDRMRANTVFNPWEACC